MNTLYLVIEVHPLGVLNQAGKILEPWQPWRRGDLVKALGGVVNGCCCGGGDGIG